LQDATGSIYGAYPDAELTKVSRGIVGGQDLLEHSCDILVLAAYQQMVHCGNAGRVNAKVVVEAR